MNRSLLTLAILAAIATVPARADEPGPAPATPEQATKAYQRTGSAPVLTASDVVRYPFGKAQPVLQCTPLYACDIELQAGEQILDVAVGDTERWITGELKSGDASAPIPHVVVKPKEANLSTNLIIGTTRRTYHLALTSPAANAQGSSAAYTRSLAFYYPDDLVTQWHEAEATAANASERSAAATQAGLAIDPSKLNSAYQVKGPDVPYKPHTVFDDGAHVYLFMPDNIRSVDAPALLAKDPDGKSVILNYRVLGTDQVTYMVDGLFTEASLVVGKKTVTIRRSTPLGSR